MRLRTNGNPLLIVFLLLALTTSVAMPRIAAADEAVPEEPVIVVEEPLADDSLAEEQATEVPVIEERAAVETMAEDTAEIEDTAVETFGEDTLAGIEDAPAVTEVTDEEPAVQEDAPIALTELDDQTLAATAWSSVYDSIVSQGLGFSIGEVRLFDVAFPDGFDLALASSPLIDRAMISVPVPDGWDISETAVFAITTFDVFGYDCTIAELLDATPSESGDSLEFGVYGPATIALVRTTREASTMVRRLSASSNTATDTNPLVFTSSFSDVSTATPHWRDIQWMFDSGISTGYGSGSTRTYRGSSSILRQDMAAFLYRLAGSPSYTPTASDKAYFSDVTSETPHAKEIWWMVSAGITTGWQEADGSRTFRGTSCILRQDMAAFLYRTALWMGQPKYTPTTSDQTFFSDVSSSSAHHDAIWWMASNGISTGWVSSGSRTFRGTNNVLRQDMAAFIHRMVEPSAGGVTEYELSCTLSQMLAWQTYTFSGGSVTPTADQLNPLSHAGKSTFYQFTDLRGYTGLTGAQLDAFISSTASGRSGVLAGHGATIAAACRYYNLNEAYLLCHMIVETAWGTSYYARMENPNLIGYGAYDTNPDECMKYAASEGWTSVDGSIWGAAKTLCNVYIYDGQPTLYEMRWQAYKTNLWCSRYPYQYCTSTTWPSTIGQLMGSLYTSAGVSPSVYYLVPVYQ